jgi:hypothetical protein
MRDLHPRLVSRPEPIRRRPRLRRRVVHRAGVTGFLAAVGLVAVPGGGGAVAGGGGAVARAAGAAPAACSSAVIQVWLGVGEGGGYAGGDVLPLEFSNVGRRSCTLTGYPGISAFRGTHQVGPAAGRDRSPHPSVTLGPRQTAHAWLRIVDASAACGRQATTAVGLRVFAPNARGARTITLPLTVCPRARVLFVGPVLAGVGIPGYPLPPAQR